MFLKHLLFGLLIIAFSVYFVFWIFFFFVVFFVVVVGVNSVCKGLGKASELPPHS